MTFDSWHVRPPFLFLPCPKRTPSASSLAPSGAVAQQAPSVPGFPSLPSCGLCDSEPSFDIDLADLESRFKNLQREVHPDKFAGSRVLEEQQYAAQYSSQINASYRLLRDPLQRASVLLRRRGVYPEKAEEQTIHDPVLLMETMEVREAIEDTDNAKELLSMQAHNNSRIAECVAELSQAFANEDTAAALRASQKLSYLNRIRDEITKKL
eukprot:CAMPEP_0117671924 /NCGR_PEP_ID=MMETSP0804-20121206/13618_1 /TAXON_ID=1074897 /ORGANISM="Tetraselmis astigmatica, Strain CCMP880" /LENGTH=209 /DNA_ID=CAMNT_0005480467 /DNA_START=218 /DNA_END=848 /DNA_ORIENTATION=+